MQTLSRANSCAFWHSSGHDRDKDNDLYSGDQQFVSLSDCRELVFLWEKNPKPAAGPMVIIILTVQWKQFDDVWQNVTCKALSVCICHLRMLRKAVGRSWPMEWDEVFVHAWGIMVDVQWKHFWSCCTGGHVVMLRNHWCLWTLLCVALGSCCSGLAVKFGGH